MITEVFYLDRKKAERVLTHGEYFSQDMSHLSVEDLMGWYWWAMVPGCMPDTEPEGPFGTAHDAEKDADRFMLEAALEDGE